MALILVAVAVEEPEAFFAVDELVTLGVPESLGSLAGVGALVDELTEVLSCVAFFVPHAARSDRSATAIRVLTRDFTESAPFTILLYKTIMNYTPLLRGRARFCSAPIGDVFLTFLLG